MPQEIEELQRSVLYWIPGEGTDLAIDFNDDDEQETEDEEEEDELPDKGGESGLDKHHSNIELQTVVRRYGVPQSIFMAHLSKEMESADSCMSLPFTLLLVISYALLAINHDDAPLVNAVEDSIGFDIMENANFAFSSEFIGHKNIDDVNTHQDFWSWIVRGFVPLLWTQSYTFSEGTEKLNWTEPYMQQATQIYSRDQRGMLLHYNRIILGVRLSQERDDAVVDNSYDRKCSFTRMQGLYDKDCVRGLGYELEPEVYEARQTRNPTRIHWLYITDDIDFVRQQLVQMEKVGWLDEHTRKIELAFPVYNAEFGLHTMFICCFFFSRGGHIWKDIIPLSAFAQNWNSYTSIFWDSIWFLCLVWIIVTEGIEIVEIVRDHGTGGIWKEYMGFYNAIDWASVLSGFIILAMFLLNMSHITELNASLSALGGMAENDDRGTYRRQAKLYVANLEAEIQYAYNFRIIQAMYPGIIALRLFKAFGSQPRLAVVTRTLHSAWIDLFHFLIIFASVFFTYTVAGVVLFGREVESFTTLFRAMITCFRAMFGDFDWDELRKVGRVDAFLWFVPFMVLIVLILLNMLIAIVMDAYDEVITGLEHEKNIWELMTKAYEMKMSNWKKDDISMSEVMRAMVAKDKEDTRKRKEHNNEDGDIDSEEDSDDGHTKVKGKFRKKMKHIRSTREKLKEPIVTIGVLKDIFRHKGIHTVQCEKFIQGAIVQYYKKNKEVGDINEVLTAIARIDYRTKVLRKRVKARVQEEGLAVNYPMKVHHISRDCFAETDTVREDLDLWLPDDEDDVLLPKYWMHAQAQELHEEGADGEKYFRPAGLMRVMKGFSAREGGLGGKVAADLHQEGGTFQILADERIVLKACRDAGIAPTYDNLRRQALGKHVQVMERDLDGTVLCKIPTVGEVWFPSTAFVPTLIRHVKDEPHEDDSTVMSDRSGNEAMDRRASELEQEVGHGKEVVEECLQALKSLHDDLMVMKTDKRRGVDKFQQYRHQAVALQRGNVAEKERFKDCQARVKEVTSERDNYFEQVKRLVKENHDLEAAVEKHNYRGSGQGKRR